MTSSMWLPAKPADRVLTSATLDEGDTEDQVTLFVLGEPFARITVPAGLGAKLLTECGLARHP